jgi:DNA-binding XRE family transcriptional regulator
VTRAHTKSPELEAAVLAGIEAGLTQTDAAQAAGIHRITLYRWKTEDEDFADRLAMAESTAKQTLTAVIVAAAQARLPQSWNAAAWLLERRWPDQYGPKARMEISVDVRQEAERLAAEHGLSVDDVLAEADTIVREHAGTK